MQRGPSLGGTREHDDCRVSRPEHSDRCCEHKLLSVVPIVSIRAEGGYAARCLLCDTTRPVRGNGEAARDMLLKQMVRA